MPKYPEPWYALVSKHQNGKIFGFNVQGYTEKDVIQRAHRKIDNREKWV